MKRTFSLYPSNIGLENGSINALIDDYNEQILTRKNLVQSGGENNPNVKNLTNTILEVRENILRSVAGYTAQLKQTKEQLQVQSRKYQKEVSSLPEKEKILRSIERSQEIQESLYLFLLQKREEAEVSYAVTEPSLKVVEYALSSEEPIAPKRPVIILGALLLGLLIPFGILYVRFLLNTKVHQKKDLEAAIPGVSILGEIPEIEDEGEKIFSRSYATIGLGGSLSDFVIQHELFVGGSEERRRIGYRLYLHHQGGGKNLCGTQPIFSFGQFEQKSLADWCRFKKSSNPQLCRS